MEGCDSRSAIINPLKSCALVGALYGMVGIQGGLVLINGPTGCEYMSVGNLDFQDCRGYGQAKIACTGVRESETIFGGEENLRSCLIEARQVYRPKFIAVVNACAISIIGDDVEGVIRDLALDVPTFYVDIGGFIGGMIDGYHAAADVLVREVMQPPERTIPGSVNLLGFMAGSYNWMNDLREARAMLSRLGIRVNAVITAGSSLREIARAPQAALNVVLYDEFGTYVAQKMEESFGTPYVGQDLYAPVGLESTGEWLHHLAQRLGLDRGRAIAREEKKVKAHVLPKISSFGQVRLFRGMNTAVFADASMALALTRFLVRSLGVRPVLLGLKSVGPHTEPLLQRLLMEEGIHPRVLYTPDILETRRALEEIRPELILGSTFEKLIALEMDPPIQAFVHVSYPVWDHAIVADLPFLGYRGVSTIVQEVLNARTSLLRVSGTPYGRQWDLSRFDR